MGISASHSSNDYELVIKSSKDLEYILELEFGAKGKGLHEKISDVDNQLSTDLIKRMRYLATIRNKLIHERGFDAIPDRSKFIIAYEDSKKEIQTFLKNKKGDSQCIIC
jgi:hypothetical protein